VKSNERTYVRRLPGDEPLDAVVAKARVFLDEGHRYGYQQIVLLALLCLTRRVKLPWAARRMVRSVLDHAAKALSDLVPTGASRMICSEYVYRSYDEASDVSPDPFRIEIAVTPTFAGTTALTSDAEDGSFLDWALTLPEEHFVGALAVAPTFGGGFDEAEATAEIDALLEQYAEELRSVGEVPADPPPLTGLSPTFAGGVPEPSVDELAASIGAFALAWSAATGGDVEPTFGGAVGGALVKGAIAGLTADTIAADFVTPGDLWKTTSLTPTAQVR
jgi:hypothetical protein